MLCKFCNKECKNDNSLRNHERLCKLNPSREISWLETNRHLTKNSNAFIKAKEIGVEFVVSNETREKLRQNQLNRTPELTKSIGVKSSLTIQAKVVAGTWHTSLAKHMHIDYNGIDLHGSWELKFAEYLDANEIKWIRNKDSFSYHFEGKDRKYTPDFYLIDSDEYVEIKGYKTMKDSAKWDQFPKHRKLKIYMRDELKILGLVL